MSLGQTLIKRTLSLGRCERRNGNPIGKDEGEENDGKTLPERLLRPAPF